MRDLVTDIHHAGFVEEVRQRGDQLCRDERFLQQHAARYALRTPVFRTIARHVDHRDRRLKFPCAPRHVPTIFLSRHPDIGKQGAEATSVRLKFGYRFVSGDYNERLKPRLVEDIGQRNADEIFVFSDKNKLYLRTFHGCFPSGSDVYATDMLHTNPFVPRIRGHQPLVPYQTVPNVATCFGPAKHHHRKWWRPCA